MTDQPLTGLGIDEIIGDKREAILRLAAEHGASNVRVFGSVARGEARPDSDVDLLITFPENRSIFDLVGLWLDTKDLMERDVSLIADAIDDKRFLNRILKDAVPYEQPTRLSPGHARVSGQHKCVYNRWARRLHERHQNPVCSDPYL